MLLSCWIGYSFCDEWLRARGEKAYQIHPSMSSEIRSNFSILKYFGPSGKLNLFACLTKDIMLVELYSKNLILILFIKISCTNYKLWDCLWMHTCLKNNIWPIHLVNTVNASFLSQPAHDSQLVKPSFFGLQAREFNKMKLHTFATNLL